MPLLISVVSPVYKAEKIVDELVRQLTVELKKITENYEIILVEDCSPDNSWQKIEENCIADKHVKGIKLSRNFGQHHAITAGLDHCSGEWVVVMDCDLQDKPEEIIKLYNEALKGYDIVYAKRSNRQDSYFKKLRSKVFKKMFEWLSGTESDHSIANFGIYNKKVIDVVNKIREPMRSFVPMVRWVGFKATSIEVVHARRFEGKTSYNLNKLIAQALDVALAYSDKPLKITVSLGITISFLSIVFGISILIEYLVGYITQPGYVSLILSIWLLSGLIIFSLGIVGLYIGKVFEGVKARPLYVVSEMINYEKIN